MLIDESGALKRSHLLKTLLDHESVVEILDSALGQYCEVTYRLPLLIKLRQLIGHEVEAKLIDAGLQIDLREGVDNFLSYGVHVYCELGCRH